MKQCLFSLLLLSFSAHSYATYEKTPRWIAPQEISFGFDRNVPRAVRDGVRGAALEWSVASGGVVAFVEERNVKAAQVQVHFIRDGIADETLAYAVVRVRFGYIIGGHMVFDGDHKFHRGLPVKTFWDSSAKIPQSYSADHTALHEWGHFIGLAHSSVPAAVMYGRLHTVLSADDLAGVGFLYGMAVVRRRE